MADNPDAGNWWGSWISAAKNKSSEVLEFVKKDLGEFGSAVKNEASNVVSSTGAVLEKTLRLDEPESTVSTMKRSFSSFLGQMNTVLNPSPDDSDTEAILITEGGSEAVPLTPLQRAVYELQKNERTFTLEPEPPLDGKFRCWLDVVEDQLTEPRLARHLAASAPLLAQYQRLVPAAVDHRQFWTRYLFRKALVEDEIAHHEAAQRRELKERQAAEQHLDWERDFPADVALSEEEQTRLLEQYERERRAAAAPPPPSQGSSEEALFVRKSPAKTTLRADRIGDNRNDDYFTADDKCRAGRLSKADSAASLDTKSNNSSSDGDWERVSDVLDK